MKVAVAGAALRSPLGHTRAGLFEALCAGACGVRAIDAWRDAGLESTHAAALPGSSGPAGPDPTAQWLLDVVGEALADAGLWREAARSARTALVVGTSAGAMQSAERFFRGTERLGASTYFAPTVRVAHDLGLAGPALTVSSACASSTIAIGIARDLLRTGRADVAIAAGYDSLSLFVQAGFAALGALCDGPPRPFRADRSGLVLGEGAAAVVLVRESGVPPLGFVTGFGMSGDARHVTAPDREGRGLARAIEAALRDGSVAPEQIDVVSAHGTATPYNDAMEALALRTTLGDGLARIPLHAAKAALGHTLGAAGILETLIVLEAMARGVVPPTVAGGEVDPGLGVALPAVPQPGRFERALKVSSAFGGANAALLLERGGRRR